MVWEVPDVKSVVIDAVASGATEVVSGVRGRKLRVVALTLVCSSAVQVSWESGGGKVICPPMSFAANGGMDVNRGIVGGTYFCQTDSGEGLVVRLSGAANVRGTLNYVEV